MPRVVREHEILRVAATIHGNDKAKSAEAARREVLTWAQNRSGGRLPEKAWNLRIQLFIRGAQQRWDSHQNE